MRDSEIFFTLGSTHAVFTILFGIGTLFWEIWWLPFMVGLGMTANELLCYLCIRFCEKYIDRPQKWN
jgi:hypothetical protein